MTDKGQIVQGLEQHALLQELDSSLQDLEFRLQNTDHELLDLEVQRDVVVEELKELKERQVALVDQHDGVSQQAEVVQQEYDMLSQRRAMLLDMKALMTGTCFQGSAVGARFFTQNLADFSQQLGQQETSIREAVKASADGFSFELGGKQYGFLEAFDRQLYFHPHAVHADQLLEESAKAA